MAGRWRTGGYRARARVCHARPWAPGRTLIAAPHRRKHAPGPGPPEDLGQDAEYQRHAEGEEQTRPGPVFERPAAQPSDEERVGGPERAGARGRGDETPPPVPDHPAG